MALSFFLPFSVVSSAYVPTQLYRRVDSGKALARSGRRITMDSGSVTVVLLPRVFALLPAFSLSSRGHRKVKRQWPGHSQCGTGIGTTGASGCGVSRLGDCGRSRPRRASTAELMALALIANYSVQDGEMSKRTWTGGCSVTLSTQTFVEVGERALLRPN